MTEIVYVRADGSIDPPSVPLLKQGDTYLLTENLTCGGVVIERDNVTLDGNGHWLQGAGSGSGITLTARTNVTVDDVQITTFPTAIDLSSSIGCKVTNNNVINCGCGVLFLDSWYANVTSNTMTLDVSLLGYWGAGLYLYGGSGNILNGNNVTWTPAELATKSGLSGISAELSSDFVLTENTVSGAMFGIHIFSGSNITLRYNKMIRNKFNFEFMDNFGNVNADSSNTVDGKPVYYWIGETNKIVPLDAGAVFLVNCSYITIQNLNISNVGEGIVLVNTNETLIRNNSLKTTRWSSIYVANSLFTTISDNSLEIEYYYDCIRLQNSNYSYITNNSIDIAGYDGILLEASSFNEIGWNNISHCDYYAIRLLGPSDNNTVFGNNIEDAFVGILVYESRFNAVIGNSVNTTGEASVPIFLDSSSNNTVYHNNILKSQYPWAGDTGSNNTWDNGYPSGGNFWLGFFGRDSNNDGISDTPYNFYGSSVDHYPLMVPYIIPEFSSFLILPLCMLATLLVITLCRRRRADTE